jgi:TetR/AcrR family tetracycline transcriptional repressor
MARRPDPNLDRERLIAAAFSQLEEEGLDGLSMRRLAGRLGVQAPALYWHVADKAELLGLMAREIYAAAYAGVPPVGDWRAWLESFGRALRLAFAAHRDGARLCAAARPFRAGDVADHARRIAQPLAALGVDQAQALSFQASVISFALGWATFEANGPMHDYLAGMLDFEASFDAGLKALVRGFAVAG